MLLLAILYVTGIGSLIAGLYLFVFAVAGKGYKAPIFQLGRARKRFAILIPAYQEDSVIASTVESVLNQKYDKNFYDVFVIADGLQTDTYRHLMNYPVWIVPVTFKHSTKAKALNAALKLVDRNKYDAITILDADNHMDSSFLERANAAMCGGHTVIQGCRKAKYSDHPLSRLDGLTEAINSNIFRRGHQRLGFPSALTGSGMTFEINLFIRLMEKAKAVGGFDKEFEMELAEGQCPVLYDEDAVVYDEKVSSPKFLSDQRSRWMGAQWHYARQTLGNNFWNKIKKGNLIYVNKAFQLILPPRVLLLSFQILMVCVLQSFGQPVVAGIWTASLFLTVSALAISIPSGRRGVLLKDALYLPVAWTFYLVGLAKSVDANKRFVHTKHNVNSP